MGILARPQQVARHLARPTLTTPPAHAVKDFLLGGVAGGVASFVTFPIDLAKTRMQDQASSREGPRGSARVGSATPYRAVQAGGDARRGACLPQRAASHAQGRADGGCDGSAPRPHRARCLGAQLPRLSPRDSVPSGGMQEALPVRTGPAHSPRPAPPRPGPGLFNGVLPVLIGAVPEARPRPPSRCSPYRSGHRSLNLRLSQPLPPPSLVLNGHAASLTPY